MNAQNSDGDTSLLLAARRDDRDTIKLLLDYSADPKIKNKDNETMLTINGFHSQCYDEQKYDESTDYSSTSSFAESPLPQNQNLNTERVNGIADDILTNDNPKLPPGPNTIKLHEKVDEVLSQSPDVNAPPNLDQMADANTVKLRQIASSIFHDMEGSVGKIKEKLVPIKGWLYHKQ